MAFIQVASLQGYLLKNKTRPRECVDEVAAWYLLPHVFVAGFISTYLQGHFRAGDPSVSSEGNRGVFFHS